MRTREAAVAGMFYPAGARELASEVNGLMARQRGPAEPPKALIAPHAGYVYSGPVAAAVYSRLRGAEAIRRVVLVGPSHRVAFSGLAVPDAQVFVTPLGAIRIDEDAVARLLALPSVSCRADAHMLEHSLEVQLPFLQMALGEFLT